MYKILAFCAVVQHLEAEVCLFMAAHQGDVHERDPLTVRVKKLRWKPKQAR